MKIITKLFGNPKIENPTTSISIEVGEEEKKSWYEEAEEKALSEAKRSAVRDMLVSLCFDEEVIKDTRSAISLICDGVSFDEVQSKHPKARVGFGIHLKSFSLEPTVSNIVDALLKQLDDQ